MEPKKDSLEPTTKDASTKSRELEAQEAEEARLDAREHEDDQGQN